VKGLFRGGEEGTVVNPARETWWTSMGGLEGVNEGLMRSGLSWDETERLSQAVFGAKTKSAFDTATSQVEQILGRSITEGINRDLFPSFTHGTGGRYLDFGPGTLALLHGREKITPAAAAEPTMRPVHVHVNLDGREIAWALVPHINVELKEVVAAGCDANAQSCDAATRTPARDAAPVPSCPAGGADEAALAGHDAAIARLRQELAAQAAAGTPLVPLNGRGYNYGSDPSDSGDAVLRFEAHPALPPR